MRNSDGVILVYDICNYSSFEKAAFWLKAVRQVTKDNITIFLLGNKLDLVQDNPRSRKVSKEKVALFITENKIDYWIECSAKTNENLSDTFSKFYMGKK